MSLALKKALPCLREKPDVQRKEPSACCAKSPLTCHIHFAAVPSLTCISAGRLPNHPHLPTQARTVFLVVAVRLSAIPSNAHATWQFVSVTLTCASPVGPQSTGTVRWCLAKTAASSVASKR